MSGPRVIWRRQDTPGHEAARVVSDGSSRLLTGTAVFVHDGEPCRLDYRVMCDGTWRTLASRVEGWVGERDIDIEIAVDPSGHWRMGTAECRDVRGCIDIDLNFSPSTNLLPIRRLGLKIGEEASVRAAWLRFPSFELEPLEQVYRRSEANLYRYQSAGGAFVRDIRVNEAGFVMEYPGFFAIEPLS